MQKTETKVSPEWRKLYEAAVLELDEQKILQRVADAEQAVKQRMDDVYRASPDGAAESEALVNALTVLLDLRKMAKHGDGA